jgi:ribonuclease Y
VEPLIALVVLAAGILVALLAIVGLLLRSRRLAQTTPLAAASSDQATLLDAGHAVPAAQAEDMRQVAFAEAARIRAEATEASTHATALRAEVEAEARAVREELRRLRIDLERRELRVADRETRLDTETRHLEERSRSLDDRADTLEQRHIELAAMEDERRQMLERVAGLTVEQARADLVAAAEQEARREAMLRARQIEREATEQADARAREVLVTAIQRVASEQTAESVVSVLHLPSDEMKGRIIGREGRNIRTFEQVTGVNLIIDDTPEAVLLSCFDPVRREVARLALEALVLDGRIHPQRIEDQVERSKAEVDELCRRAAEEAMAEVGVAELHPELVRTLGRLRYRTSYGQNVLRHLVESAHLAGLMAVELRMDPTLVKRAAFLHDIGKALTHEVEGSHAVVGADLARRFGEDPEVVHAIEAHHNEVEPHSVEAVLTQAADAVSGSRPGARRESLEAYVQRLERLEQIATSKAGVEKVFAMQAGREVRVMVLPDEVDDLQAQVLARDIAKQVEEELTYPGHIRITVVRESRAIETAR